MRLHLLAAAAALTLALAGVGGSFYGHYTQFLCLNASNASKVRKIFSSYAFVEGWALYGEEIKKLGEVLEKMKKAP